ncbi:hypothetical protein QQX98_001596 [Neonectria punicea]|uniref:BZIP domain-containing protein n=1 Tax=Neonectria punicea TaxID=979145 RepID=A0ABR1HMX1_9HYPO
MPKRKLSSRQRKKMRRLQNALLGACVDAEDQGPPVSGDPPAATTPPMPTTPLPEDLGTPHKSDDPTSPGQPRLPRNKKQHPCRHRRLPDRNYYHRLDTLDRRYLGFHRRVQELLDKKINEGTREVARWKLKIEKTLMELERGTDQYAKQERRELLVRADALEYRDKELLDKITNLEKKVGKLEEKVSKVESQAERDRNIPDLVRDWELDCNVVGDDYTIQTSYVSGSAKGLWRDAHQREMGKPRDDGSGSYGTVSLQHCTEGPRTDKHQAVKRIHVGPTLLSAYEADVLSRELPSIIKFSHRQKLSFISLEHSDPPNLIMILLPIKSGPSILNQ